MIAKSHTLVLSLILLFNLGLNAQSLLGTISYDTEVTTEPPLVFSGIRLFNGQSVETVSGGELKFNIQHRFGKISDGFYNLFGIDNAEMRLGVDYGISDNVTIIFGRGSLEKTYDLSLKTRILRQDNNSMPLGLTVLFGSSINTLKNVFPESRSDFSSRLTYSSQLILAKSFNGLSIQTAPTFIYSVYDPRIMDQLVFYSIGFGGKVKIGKRLDATFEYYLGLKDLSFDNYNPLTVGIDLDTGGHLFQILISNSAGMYEKAYLTNTGFRWIDGDIFFGFNLIRTFYLN